MRTLVFVYGTLKKGFANFGVNSGIRVDGEFETAKRFPLYIISEYYIPWLVDVEGEGAHVLGQLFEVDELALGLMDELERLNEPGWFTRRKITVRERAVGSEAIHEAFVYFGSAERACTEVVHAGPISCFSSGDDAEYRERAA